MTPVSPVVLPNQLTPGGVPTVMGGQRRRPAGCGYLPRHFLVSSIHMPQPPEPRPESRPQPLYCPNCAREVTDPLTCGDCSAVICRVCGTPLESPDELGMG
jgi:hypothetical protein